jgi:hypothetical protein
MTEGTGAFSDLEHLVVEHQQCGDLTGDAGELGPAGYLLWISCPCGARFER